MKVYSTPEVLEDHIAPAVILPGSNFSGVEMESGSGSNQTVNIVNGTPHFDSIALIRGDFQPSPSVTPTLTLADNLSEFNIRTIRVGVDASLFGDGALDFDQLGIQALLGETSVESILTDEAAISLLAEELSISNGVIEAIEPAVGDVSTELMGLLLSSDEYSRASGSAFLTSL